MPNVAVTGCPLLNACTHTYLPIASPSSQPPKPCARLHIPRRIELYPSHAEVSAELTTLVVVLTSPFLDHAEVIEPGKPLPYPDNNFDIVFARSVFEHIEDPEWLARELLRIVKPGGLIAAFTPNKFGYFAVAARMVPNRLHVGTLSKIQPGRKAEDVFPTHYRLNTAALLRKAFGEHALV